MKDKESGSHTRFNSIVVRLKGFPHTRDDFNKKCFNSIVVRLKGGLVCYTGIRLYRFNSIVVGLKGNCATFSESMPILSFNSIVVRLKADRGQYGWNYFNQFQFHSGSIKRVVKTINTPADAAVSIP